MAEPDVESILREIRERVTSQERANHDAAAAAARAKIRSEVNGTPDSGRTQQMARREVADTTAAENLALINSYLTTTARTWDRLPPVLSNRSGLVARLELWIKRRLKVATRWFTWEQVNFNAAVHHALRDILPVLAAYEQELGKLRAEIEAATKAATEARRIEFGSLRGEIEASRRLTDAQRAQVENRLSELVKELRQRDERLQGEQRVSFKQLALETSEAAVLEDRARRNTRALLEELTRRVEQLEK